MVILPGGGELIGDSPERRVEILCDHDALNATWSRFGPGRAGADLHVHRLHSDLFYVLEGELTVRLDSVERVVPAGTLARVPPLVVHGFRNGSDADVRYLNFHAPGRRFADYLRALRDGRTFTYDQEPPPADGARPPSEVELTAGPGVLADVDAITVAERTGAADAPPLARLRAYYVLEGELAVGDARAPAGAWAHVAPGVEHAVRADSARYLEIHAGG